MNYKNNKQEKYLKANIRRRNIDRSPAPWIQKEPSEDTKNRQLIQIFIFELTAQINDEEQVMSLLNKKFEDTKYDAYRPFFRQWVHDKFKNQKKERDEER